MAENGIAVAEKPVLKEGQVLTGKQEHCKHSCRLGRIKADAFRRSEARTHRPTDQVRDYRAELSNCFTAIWGSFQIRFWRGLPSRF